MAGEEYQQGTQSSDEEDEALRAEILARIDSLEADKGQVQGIIDAMKSEKAKVCNQMEALEKQKHIYNSGVLSRVIVPNIFEGVCADVTQERIDSGIAIIDQIYDSANSLGQNIDTQIDRLQEQVTDIENEITGLWALL